MSFKLLKKIVSTFTLAVFMSTNIAYAAPESKSIFKNKKIDYRKLSDKNEGVIQKKKVILTGEDTSQSELQKKEARKVLSTHLSDLSLIHIPEELGKVVEVYQNPGHDNSKLVVHIQDLHTNPEASLNLAKILDILLKDYKMGLVCSEGADGVVDTSSVSGFPDADVREKVARLFIDSGELTGEEYLSITKYPELPIWGIENKDIYFKNIVEFNNIMKFNPDSQVFISQVKKALEELKPKIYSKELLAIDQKELDYDNQKIETVDYLKHLSSYIQKLNIPTANYKNIALLDETMSKESKIDQQKIMQESQNLLLNLQSAITGKSNRSDMDTLMAKASLFKDQKISPFSFYSYLKDLANKHLKDQLSKYPNLMDFVDYLTKVNSLDSTKLFIEMGELTYEIKQRLARNDEEKALTQNLRNIKFLEGFFNLKVSNEELDYYLENRGSHKTGYFEVFLKPAIKKYNLSSFVDFNPDLIDFHLQELEDFYKTAKSRDLIMFNNSVSEIEKRNIKVSALISGGFHTKGLTRLLKDKGYSYIVISPFSKTEIDEENYHFLLSGKRRPIEDLINQLDVPKPTGQVSKNLRVPLASDPDTSKGSGKRLKDAVSLASNQEISWEDEGNLSSLKTLNDIAQLAETKEVGSAAEKLLISALTSLSDKVKKEPSPFFDRFLDGIVFNLAPEAMIYLKGIGLQFVNGPSFVDSVKSIGEKVEKEQALASTIDMKLVKEAKTAEGETWEKTAVRRTPPAKLAIVSREPLQRELKRTLPLGINGSGGRIGLIVSATIRNYYNPEDMRIVAVNGISDIEKYIDSLMNPDPTYGDMMALPGDAEVKYGFTNGQAWISINGNKILVFNEREGVIPWWKVALDKDIGKTALINLFVQEASGKGLTTKDATTKHINGGASSVLFTANAKDATNTIVLGVNDSAIANAERIAAVQANASCTSNCLGPVVAVLNGNWGLGVSYTNTNHAITGDQTIEEFGRPEEAYRGYTALSFIFTKTGAAKSIPPLLSGMGPADGHALRGPWQTASVVDWVGELLKKPANGLQEVKEAFMQAAKENPEVIGIGHNMDAVNMKGRTESVVIDIDSLELIEAPSGRVFLRIRGAWYDNEWAYGAADMRFTMLIAKRLEEGAVLTNETPKPAKEQTKKPVVLEKDIYVPRTAKAGFPLPRIVRPSREVKGTVGIVLNGISLKDETGSDIIRNLILTSDPNFKVIALNGAIKTLEELREYAAHIDFVTNYPRLKQHGVKVSGHQTPDGQLYLDILYDRGSRISIPVYNKEDFNVPAKNAIIVELNKGYKELSLKTGQMRVYAPSYDKEDGFLAAESINIIQAESKEVTIPSSLGVLYAQVIKALKDSGLDIEMISLQAMTTPRQGAELVASGGRAGHLNNLIPMKQDETDRLRQEVEALIGKDTPMSFGGYTAPVFPGIAYGGIVLFFKGAIPYSEEGDKLAADAQIDYIHQILRERLKGIVELSDVPEVGEHVRGMSLPRIAVKTTKIVDGILVTLVPTVDERYSSAHRTLQAVLDLAIANGRERLAEASKPDLAAEGSKATMQLASNADVTRREQVDSLDQIIAVDAAKVIADKKGFESWIANQPENIAVVIIALSDNEYENVKQYENIASIKLFDRDIKGEENRLAMVAMFGAFGKPEFFGGFKLGEPANLDKYKTVVSQIASGV